MAMSVQTKGRRGNLVLQVRDPLESFSEYGWGSPRRKCHRRAMLFLAVFWAYALLGSLCRGGFAGGVHRARICGVVVARLRDEKVALRIGVAGVFC